MSTDFTNSAKALWVTLSLLTKVLGSAKIETPKSTISIAWKILPNLRVVEGAH